MAGEPAQMPSPSDTRLPEIVIPLTILLCIALITYGLRLYTRCRPYYNLKLDDHAMTIAVAFTIATYAVVIALVACTGGRHTRYVPLAGLVKNAKLGFISRPLWVWSNTMIK